VTETAKTERDFLLTHSETDGEYSHHLHYLLANGARVRLTIGSAFDSPEMRDKLGVALHKHRVEGKQ